MNYCVPNIEIICKHFGYKYAEGELERFHIEKDRIVLIAGAGIIQDDFVQSHTIINAHPGYIPNCRGLDALKWAIVNGAVSLK